MTTKDNLPTFSGMAMCGNETEYYDIAIKSLLDLVDEFVIVYDDSTPDSTKKVIQEIIMENQHIEWKFIYHRWEGFTAQKNYLREQASKDYLIFVDMDEVYSPNVADLKRIAQETNFDAMSFRSFHFIDSLVKEDATREKHYHWRRCVKNRRDFTFEGDVHEIATFRGEIREYQSDSVTIHHLGYVKDLMKIQRKWELDVAKPQIHSKEFVDQWKRAHLFGTYPTKPYDPRLIPKLILDKFSIDPDELYFKDRKLETKHFIDAGQWRDHFKPESVLEVGCGRGPRVYAMRTVGMTATGIELSKWAVENAFCQGLLVGNVLDMDYNGRHDLVIAYDVLEHLETTDVKKALTNLYNATKKYVLISVPVIGDPNLLNDPTHKTHWTKDQWTEAIEDAGFKMEEVPEHFLYRDQLFIGVKDEKK